MTDTFDPSHLLNHTRAQAPTFGSEPAAAIGLTSTADPAAAETPPVFHTVAEVARTLGVSPKTIGRRIRDGVIRKVPMGGRLVRISSAELQRLAAHPDR